MCSIPRCAFIAALVACAAAAVTATPAQAQVDLTVTIDMDTVNGTFSATPATRELDFGIQAIDVQSAPRTVAIFNNTPIDLSLSSAALSDPLWKITTTVGTLGIGAGSTVTFEVRLNPLVVGPVSGAMTLNQPGLDVNLRGIGVAGYEGRQGTRLLGPAQLWSLPSPVVRTGLGPMEFPGGRRPPPTPDVYLKATGSGIHVIVHGKVISPIPLNVVLQGTTSEFLFKAARAHVNVFDGPSYAEQEYQAEIRPRLPADAEWRPFCEHDGYAIATPGGWDGGRMTAMPALSLACVPTKDGMTNRVINTKGGSVVAKCNDWAYKAWFAGRPPRSPDGRPGREVLVTNDANAAIVHQACIRMAMADYCGTGLPNTMDETPIVMSQIFNFKQVAQYRAPVAGQQELGWELPYPRGFFLECAWTADHAFCCSKKRWATLPPRPFNLAPACRSPKDLPAIWTGPCKPPTGVCASHTSMDPRAPCAAAPSAVDVPRFCEDVAWQDLLKAGVRLLNYSVFIDVGLYRIERNNMPVRTGIDVAFEDTGEAAGSGYFSLRPEHLPATYEGTIFSEAASRAGVLPPSTIALYQYKTGVSSYRTTTDRPSDRLSGAKLLGYILDKTHAGEGRPALWLYDNCAGGTSVTTSGKQPVACGSPGKLLGYLIFN